MIAYDAAADCPAGTRFFSVPLRFSIGQNRISDGRKINGTAAGDPAAALR
ncbi:hypothetical protein B4135_1412 [Caldibacillus debilis]|uniref:Uncharacterized protein n=1 Tax=Caldibacillus debilis TaxID=301148 RepID=A0A150MDA4_9BACI|nr:hypothetical protein B4135_1412 [Caldibacillus debilis]